VRGSNSGAEHIIKHCRFATWRLKEKGNERNISKRLVGFVDNYGESILFTHQVNSKLHL
jgi:hypothetical protein